MAQYLPILAMIVLVVLFAGLSFAASKLLGPRRPTSAKEAPYECGIVPEEEPGGTSPAEIPVPGEPDEPSEPKPVQPS